MQLWTVEVDAYLADPLPICRPNLVAYPDIRNVYLKMNTGLPESAAVERLFSLGGQILTPLCSHLNNEHF